LYINPKY